MSTRIRFAETETEAHVDDLRVGDFVTYIPNQGGIRGVRVDSGIKSISAVHYEQWKLGGHPVGSRIIAFHRNVAKVDVPNAARVMVRRRLDPQPGDTVRLRFWNGAGFAEMAGTVEAIEPNDDFEGDRREDHVILREDDAMAYFRRQITHVNDAPLEES